MTSLPGGCCVLMSTSEGNGTENCGTSASCFMQVFSVLTECSVNVTIVTLDGATPAVLCEGAAEEAWFEEHKYLFNCPMNIADVHEADYASLLVPSGLGCLWDMAESKEAGELVKTILQAQKPVCVVEHGVAALFSSMCDHNDTLWFFDDWSMTTVSSERLARLPAFGSLPILPEDFVRDKGGLLNGCDSEMHTRVVVDRLLVSAGNVASTAIAVRNMVWMYFNH